MAGTVYRPQRRFVIQTLWNIFVAVMLTVVELIVSAFLLAPGPTWRWVRRKVRELFAWVPRPRWQPERQEAGSWQR